jgi:hypothetical protein
MQNRNTKRRFSMASGQPENYFIPCRYSSSRIKMMPKKLTKIMAKRKKCTISFLFVSWKVKKKYKMIPW